MPKVLQEPGGLWSVFSDDGHIIASGLSNSQAWRRADISANEAVSSSQMAKDFKEPEVKATQSEKQDFFSGLLFIERDRSYGSGWAWHNFCDKFGHRPDGLHQYEITPNKSVWGWVNRKAIKKKIWRQN